MLKRLMFFIALLIFPVSAHAVPQAQEPLKVGEIFAYSALPDEAEKWQQGWKLAQKEINDGGGVLGGRKLEIISRDDKANPSETVRILDEFKNREGIKIFIGTLHSHTALAASAYAKQNDMLMFRGYGGTSKLTGAFGHDLYLQIQPPTTVWGGILSEKAAQSGKKRWAFIVADYELGRSIVDTFKTRLKAENPDVTFLQPQWFPIGKLDAGSVAQAIAHEDPDGIFVVAFGSDYHRLVREGRKRKLFENRLVMGPYEGYAGYLKELGAEAPVGWYSVDAYPFNKIEGVAHKHFLEAFRKDYHEDPLLPSFYAYSVIKILAEALDSTGTDDPRQVTQYIKSHSFIVPGYTLNFRADGISNLGEWAGFTGFEHGDPTILNPTYIAPEKYLPTVDENMKQWTH